MSRVVLAAVAVAVALACVPAASALRGDLTFVSRTSAGVAADGPSYFGMPNHDGRYVLFESGADNLSDADDDSVEDLYVRDVVAGTTELVSRADGPDGAGSADGGSKGAISADGRRVVFQTVAKLTGDDADPVVDVFLRDLDAGTTTLVSRATGADGAPGDAASSEPAISPDGRYVAFTSDAKNLSDADLDATRDVFVRDLELDTTTLVSVASDESPVDTSAYEPSISQDGRLITFGSMAANLSDADNDPRYDVFVRDLEAGTTAWVSHTSAGEPLDTHATHGVISRDGSVVVFDTVAQGDEDDSNGTTDVYASVLASGALELVSRRDGATGAVGNQSSDAPSVSADGRYVAFESNARNFSDVDGDTPLDMFVRDRVAHTTRLVSRAGAAGPAGDDSSYTYGGAISGDGRWVAFEGDSTNFSDQDVDPLSDVWLADYLGATPSCTDAAQRITGATTVALPCTDPEGDALTRAIVAGPAHGTLGAVDQAAGSVLYTPAEGYAGPDAITFTASDASGAGSTATVTLDVVAPPACDVLLTGTRRTDRLTGTPAGDRLLGLRGRDVLRGLDGDDCLDGGRGRDRMAGGAGNDRLEDAAGRDRFSGGAGDDLIRARDKRGRRVRDRVVCGPGADRAIVDRRDRVAASCETVRRRKR